MPTVQTIDIIDSNENYNKIALKGQLYMNQSFDLVKNPSLLVVPAESGGVNLPSMPTGFVRIRNLSGNEPMYIGGTGNEAPYVLDNGIFHGFELMGDKHQDFPVNNGSLLSVVAKHSGQRINWIGFLNGNDVELNNVDPAPADFVAPLFISSSPASGVSGIELDLRSPQIANSGAISITFNEALSPESGNFVSGNLNVRVSGDSFGLSGTLGLESGDSTTMTFAPMSGLIGSKIYQVRVGQNITDVAGNAFGSNLVIPFTTYTVPSPANIVSSWPSSGSSGLSFTLTGALASGGSGFVSVLFDKALASGASNVNSGNISLRPFGSNSGWSGTQSLSSDYMSLMFTPASVLSGNQQYEIVVGSGLQEGRYNLPKGSQTLIPFTTKANPSAPSFVSSWPASGSSGLAFDLNSSGGSGLVTVTFNKAILSGAANINSGTINLKISGNGSGWSGTQYILPGDSSTIVFDPASSLSGSKIYVVTVGSGLKEAEGNVPFGQTLTIPFTTDANPPPPDVTSPWVATPSPLLGAIGVAISVAPSALMSEKVDSATVGSNSVKLFQGANDLPGIINLGGDTKTITFTPNTQLSGSTVYNFRVSGIKDLIGNTQTAASGYSGAFTTVAVDNTPPFVQSATPVRGAAGIALSVAPQVVYNEALLASSISTSTIQLYQVNSPIVGSVALAGDNVTVTFTPSSALSGNTTYNFRASGVKDAASNTQSAASGYSGAFTTVPVDVTPPFVISGNPSGGASGLATSTHPAVTYNEDLMSSSVSTSTIALYLAGVAVGGSVALGADNRTATFTPTTNLDNSVTYNFRASGVKDSAGNTQTAASGYSGAFTTQTAGQASTQFYNASDNGSSRALSSVSSRRAGWRFGTGSSDLGKKIVKAQVRLDRNTGGGSPPVGGVSLTQLDGTTGALKMKLFLNGDPAPAFSSFSTTVNNYVWELSGTASVTIAANDVLVLDMSGTTGTGSSDELLVMRNSSDVQHGPGTRWCSTDFTDTTHVITTDQSGIDMAGILYEPA